MSCTYPLKEFHFVGLLHDRKQGGAKKDDSIKPAQVFLGENRKAHLCFYRQHPRQ